MLRVIGRETAEGDQTLRALLAQLKTLWDKWSVTQKAILFSVLGAAVRAVVVVDQRGDVGVDTQDHAAAAIAASTSLSASSPCW